MKRVRYFFEYLFLLLMTGIFLILPWKKASNLGGKIGRWVGPKLAASRKARRHISRAFPDKSAEDVEEILLGMWDNLGRVMAEYPHLKRISKDSITYTPDSKKIIQSLIDDDKPAILVSAHFSNWEIVPYALFQCGLDVHSVYRRPNNPYVANLLQHYRMPDKRIMAFPKSKAGSIQIVRAMKKGEHIGMLIDQKYNEGIDSNFFGRPAPTSTLFIDLAHRFDCPIVFGFAVRQDDGSFAFSMLPPIQIMDKNGEKRPVQDIVDEYHRVLEGWINKNPAQWLWIHRRWRDS